MSKQKAVELRKKNKHFFILLYYFKEKIELINFYLFENEILSIFLIL